MNPSLKIFTRTYAELQNTGTLNHSDITEWEYNWANLSYPDGYSQDRREIVVLSKRDKPLRIIDYPNVD